MRKELDKTSFKEYPGNCCLNLPQVVETSPPQPMDVAGEGSLYYELMMWLYLDVARPKKVASFISLLLPRGEKIGKGTVSCKSRFVRNGGK